MPDTFFIFLTIGITLAFFRQHMHDDRPLMRFRDLQDLNQALDVMAVDRSEIFQPELTEHAGIDHAFFYRILHVLQAGQHRLADIVAVQCCLEIVL